MGDDPKPPDHPTMTISGLGDTRVVDLLPRIAEAKKPTRAGMTVKRANAHRPDEKWCFACFFLIDEKHRTVECKRCGRKWDPISALMEIARKWDHYASDLAGLRNDIKRYTEDRERLRKEVANLKAQRRRLTT